MQFLLSFLGNKKFYYLGLFLVSSGMVVSEVAMSIGTIMLGVNWLFMPKIEHRIEQLKQNRFAHIFIGFYLLHVIGIVYSSDLNYSLEELRKKLPIFVFGIVLSSSEKLSAKSLKIYLYLFLATLFVSSILSLLTIFGYGNKEILDYRDASLFISHIRFSLMICFSLFVAIYYFKIENKTVKIILGLYIIYMLLFLTKLGYLTGLIIFFAVILGHILIRFLQSNLLKKTIAVAAIILFIIPEILLLNWYNKLEKTFPTNTDFQEKSINGEIYFNDLLKHEKENDHFVWVNIAWKELEENWNKRGSISFHERDKVGNVIRETVLRYLTSKGLNKDSVGVWSLSKTDIDAIENGIANYSYLKMNIIEKRFEEIKWEISNYKFDANPNGHSLTMRFEFWETGLHIIRKNWLIGVGPGDVKNAFEKAYDELNSSLNPQNRMRSHNQFIETGVAFGLVGMVYFFILLLFPFREKWARIDFLYISFFITVVLSFITEDTLETQAGITFYAFFTCFLIFLRQFEKPNSNPQNSSLN